MAVIDHPPFRAVLNARHLCARLWRVKAGLELCVRGANATSKRHRARLFGTGLTNLALQRGLSVVGGPADLLSVGLAPLP